MYFIISHIYREVNTCTVSLVNLRLNIFQILLIKDNFVKLLIIFLFYTTIIIFLNTYKKSKTTYNKKTNERYFNSYNYFTVYY